MQSRIFALTLSILFFTGACGDDDATTMGQDPPDGTTTDVAPTTDEPTTGDAPTTTDPTSDPSTSSASDPTTGDATTGVDPTGEPETDTGATTDVDPTGDEPDPATLTACTAYCERWGECGFQPDLAGCIAGCADDLSGADGACEDASVAALDCQTALDCLALIDSSADGGACGAEKEAATNACNDLGCAESFFSEGDACELTLECEGEPLREMICDGPSCICLEGGEQVGQCAAEGACLEVDALGAKAAACCGFA